jgi:predicted DNA-binding protein
MATVKMTFSLDEETAKSLEATAERLALPKSRVVREAIRDYAARAERLGETERKRLLALFDQLVPQIPERPAEQVDAEIAAVREARRGGGRRSAAP